MQITVFGANGNTGQEVVKAALQKGHTVVAAVRRVDTVALRDRMTVVKIDFNDLESVKSAINGSSAVVSTIGSGGLTQARKSTTLYSDSIRVVREAMRACGVTRIVVASSGGLQEEPGAPWVYNNIIRRYIMNTYMDMARMEAILEESPDVEWTSVRLTYLVKGANKPYKAVNKVLGEGSYTFKISFADAADFMVKEVESKQWIRKWPVLSY